MRTEPSRQLTDFPSTEKVTTLFFFFFFFKNLQIIYQLHASLVSEKAEKKSQRNIYKEENVVCTCKT
jgi:hypothetical protein